MSLKAGRRRSGYRGARVGHWSSRCRTRGRLPALRLMWCGPIQVRRSRTTNRRLRRHFILRLGSARLEELVARGSTVAIVVDDPSRWTPVREALPTVLKRLHGAGVRPEDVTISVGVGRHAPVDTDAMRRRVGEEIAAGYRCFSPPVDDLTAYDDLGQTPHGIPVRIFRPVGKPVFGS